MELTPGMVATYCGLGTLAFTGYSLYIQAQFRSFREQSRKIDRIEGDLQDLKVEMVENFATKRDLKDALDRIHEDFRELKSDIRHIRDSLEDRN